MFPRYGPPAERRANNMHEPTAHPTHPAHLCTPSRAAQRTGSHPVGGAAPAACGARPWRGGWSTPVGERRGGHSCGRVVGMKVRVTHVCVCLVGGEVATAHMSVITHAALHRCTPAAGGMRTALVRARAVGGAGSMQCMVEGDIHLLTAARTPSRVVHSSHGIKQSQHACSAAFLTRVEAHYHL